MIIPRITAVTSAMLNSQEGIPTGEREGGIVVFVFLQHRAPGESGGSGSTRTCVGQEVAVVRAVSTVQLDLTTIICQTLQEEQARTLSS